MSFRLHTLFRAGLLAFLLLSFAPRADATTNIIHECLCKLQEPDSVDTTERLFTGDEWLNTGYTPSQTQCETYCTGYVLTNNATLISSTYGYHEETLRPVVYPVLGVPIPGLKFSEAQLNSSQFSVNFLGEYISAVYNWLIGVAAVFAVIMIIVGGIQYMISGGSRDGVKVATERIRNALIGVVILLGSYVLLETTNPRLTFLGPLKISVVAGIPAETIVPGPDSTTSKKLCSTIRDCEDFCKSPKLVPEKTMGMAAPNQVQDLVNMDGLKVSGSEQLLPEAKQKLEQAAAIAFGKGYTLVVVDTYRPLKNQVNLVCNEIRVAKGVGRAPRVPSAIAWPGSSAHGSGTAIDVRLGDKNGTSLWNVSFGTQREARLEDVRTLAEIMYAAGWQRYHKEIWHFQTNTGTCTSTNACFGYPNDEGCKC